MKSITCHKIMVNLALLLCLVFAFPLISFAESVNLGQNLMDGEELERDWAVLIKTVDGQYYEVPVKTNEGYYGEGNQCFSEIDESKYIDAKQDSMMSLARADGKPFKYTAIFKRHGDENAVSIEKEVLEMDFHFHEAYETSFNSSSLKSKIPDRDNIDWKMVLNKDLIVEEPYYLKLLNYPTRNQTLSINYNMIIDGQGHKIYRTRGDSGYIVKIERAIDDKAEQNKPTVVFKNLTIDGRVNGNGEPNFRGILLIDRAHLTLSEGTTIQNCRTHRGYAGGAGVDVDRPFSSSGSTILEIQKGASIRQCVSIHGGGGVDLGKGTRLIMNGGEISNCHSEKGGGAISAFSDCEINIEEATFSENSTKEYGGALESRMNNNDIKIGNVLFTNNQAKKGGAIYVEDCALNIKESSFSNNGVGDSGGAVYSRGTDLTINDSKFEKNNASHQGGAVEICFSQNKDIVVEDSEFIDNTAGWYGGGIYVAAKQMDLIGCILSNNSASTGGGMYISKSDMNEPAVIEDTIFDNNFAKNGAGAYLEDKTDLKKVVFRDNGNSLSKGSSSMAVNGGGLHINWGAEVNISENSIFENNIAMFGGAISFNDGKLTIKDSTVAKNIASGPRTLNGNEGLGGGIYVGQLNDGYNKLAVINSVIRQNKGSQGAGVYMRRGFAEFKNVDFNNNFTTLENKFYGEGGGLYLSWGAKADLVDGTKFRQNKARCGGAIYTKQDSTKDPIHIKVPIASSDPYQNLKIDKSVIFKGNEAISGLNSPPSNYREFTNLKYDEKNSDLPYALSRKSLLNNYDINYKVDPITITYDANGGIFENQTSLIMEHHSAGDLIKIKKPPVKEGFIFVCWMSPSYKPYDSYLVTKDQLFVAKWKRAATVKFDLNYLDNNGKAKQLYDRIDIAAGETLDSLFPADPHREGYLFEGWNTKSDGSGETFYKYTPVKKEVILYAQWKKVFSSDLKNEGKDTIDNMSPSPLLNRTEHFTYLNGYPDHSFKPEENMSRAEVAVMFSRLLRDSASLDRKYNRSFYDVSRDAWFYEEVSYMSELGILSGYPNGTFKPSAPITRAEFSVMASQFDSLTGGDKKFCDLKPDHWAYRYIMSAASKGWITGYPDGNFRPDRSISRSEVVCIVNRMLERRVDKDFIDENHDKLVKYIDLDENHWAYYEIMEATN